MPKTKKEVVVPEPSEITIKIVKPHDKKSRTVINSDITRILADAEQMCMLMDGLVQKKVFSQIYALAHPQITNHDPLRFFAVNIANESVMEQMPDHDFIIINPKIIRHTSVPSRKDEGCVTFPMMGMIRKDRWHKCEVEYQTLEESEDKLVLTSVKKASVSGKIAQVWQHESDHFDCDWLFKLPETKPVVEPKTIKGVKASIK